MRHHFRCITSGHPSEASVHRLECTECGAPFEIEYEKEPDAAGPRLPLAGDRPTVSLGEGHTPTRSLAKLAEWLGLRELTAKLEFMSPTGSFKDRGTAALMSVAVEQGVEEFVEDSSGNAGASLAAYAAAAGLKAHIFVPSGAGQGKKDQIRIFGAELHQISGPRQAVTDAAKRWFQEKRLVYLSHNMSPYFAEGMKGLAYELLREDSQLPDHIIFPVGNGSLLVGAYKGFRELQDAGRIRGIPRLHCVQAESVMPIVAALDGEPWGFDQAAPTVAGGIAVSRPPRLPQVVEAVRETAGLGVSVPDAGILAWHRKLASSEGIFGEATSAAALAGLERLVRDGVIAQEESALVPITGSGLKEPVAGD